jgi:hypothetical protein
LLNDLLPYPEAGFCNKYDNEETACSKRETGMGKGLNEFLGVKNDLGGAI